MLIRKPPTWLENVMKITAKGTEWKYFELTSVQYPTNDAIGKIYALISQLPIWIFIILVSFVLFGKKKYRKRLSIIIIGLLLNEAINNIMKIYIKEERPFVNGRTTLSFGMPSSHCQFMSFFFVNCVLLIRKSNQKFLKKLLDFVITFVLVIAVALSRLI